MEKERTDRTNINGKMIDLTQTIPIPTLNTNSKNTPIKNIVKLDKNTGSKELLPTINVLYQTQIGLKYRKRLDLKES